MDERNTSIEMYTDAGGEYRWRMTVGDEIVAVSSEGYQNKADCRHAAHLMRMAGHRLGKLSSDYRQNRAGKWYWVMTAENGETIAVSPQSYANDREGKRSFTLTLRRAQLGGYFASRITDATDE